MFKDAAPKVFLPLLWDLLKDTSWGSIWVTKGQMEPGNEKSTWGCDVGHPQEGRPWLRQSRTDLIWDYRRGDSGWSGSLHAVAKCIMRGQRRAKGGEKMDEPRMKTLLTNQSTRASVLARGGGEWRTEQHHLHREARGTSTSHVTGAGEEKWSIRATWKWGFLKQHILLMFWFLNYGNMLPLRKQQAINSKANGGCHLPQPWRLTATPALSPATAVDLHPAVCITAVRGESRHRGHRLRLQLRKWNSCFWERWGRCFQLMDMWSVTLFPMNIAGLRTCGTMCAHRNQTQGPAHRGSLGIPFYVRLCTRKISRIPKPSPSNASMPWLP